MLSLANMLYISVMLGLSKSLPVIRPVDMSICQLSPQKQIYTYVYIVYILCICTYLYYIRYNIYMYILCLRLSHSRRYATQYLIQFGYLCSCGDNSMLICDVSTAYLTPPICMAQYYVVRLKSSMTALNLHNAYHIGPPFICIPSVLRLV